jgi:hypothetical protein
MDKNTLFAKTDQGREALGSRPPSLRPRLRSLLIMIDGKRSVAEMDQVTGGEGSAAPLLEQLEAEGWIARLNGAAPAASQSASAHPSPEKAPAATDVEPGTSAATLPFKEARSTVVRFINDQMGPMGEQLAMRVESCKTPADLQAALSRIRDGLRNFKGQAAVQRFDQEFVPRLPIA